MIRASLFTSSFKKTAGKYVLRTLKIILGFIILFASYRVLCRLVVNDAGSYTRIAFHEMYEQDNIDVLFLGASHVYRALDTAITDKGFGRNTFNGSTSAQDYDGAYAILKEVAKYNDIQDVYLDVYYNVGQTVKENRQPYSINLIGDYMKPSYNKTEFLLKALPKEQYITSFFLPRRNWKALFDANRIDVLLDIKDSEEYKSYMYINDHDGQYAGKGYVFNTNEVPEYHNYSSSYCTQIPESPFLDYNLADLHKIIDYCNNHNIRLSLISVPMTEFRLYNVENYDYYIQYMNKLAYESNIEYYDFNLCKAEYFKEYDNMFYDDHHMNKTGAEAFSKLFSEFFTGQIKEEDLFYNSYEEKIADIPYRILGYFDCIEDSDTDNPKRYFTLSAIDHINQEYKFSISDENGNSESPVEVQDYSPNTKLELPIDGHGKIYVELKNPVNCPKTLEYEY